MLRTKAIITGIADIPSAWIFENYIGLTEKLIGQDIKIKSIFNPTEKDPSMCVYYDVIKNKYMFKDFSSGNSGDGVNLVQYLYNMSIRDSYYKIEKDYKLDCISNTNNEHISTSIHKKYRFVDYTARNWNKGDGKYWTKYYIDSKDLEHYNVMPIQTYNLSNGEELLIINGNNIYGYFKKDGTLYKIYQPCNERLKFLKVKDYIQGSDQLTFTKPNLVIHSSLKDIMAFNKLKFNSIECIAPDSENTYIPEKKMWEYIQKYESVITLFDNDNPGKKAIERYKLKFGVNGFLLNMEKDVSDSIKEYGLYMVKETIYPELLSMIKTNKRCQENSTLE